ncbi:formimidoylglutamate deiminase [Telmatobacter bradus]|uniref:formimidoylglutamate deiminase n=1 Tax=Telmatobacter bradus TaxID=474953 RepID=UPI003B431E46
MAETILYRPELLYRDGAFLRNAGLLVNADGRIASILTDTRTVAADRIIELPGKALLPGFVNAHSHAFQRAIRGRAESRAGSGRDFWSWRNTMYFAAASLSPAETYDVARMAFLEMALSGTTTVGEFHYLHTQPDGTAYEDPNELAKAVIRAAQSVGIRIVLLRTAYMRSGFQIDSDPGQKRFFENRTQYMSALEALVHEYADDGDAVRVGAAPHSTRAVPLTDLREIVPFARSLHLPLHMHISEQVGENEASLREYGVTPVALLQSAGLSGTDWTAIHATHLDRDEMAMWADAGAAICACPTTERNLGDGIFPAAEAMRLKIPIALGSDSQAQIDPLEDARQLEYHLRLEQQRRTILDSIDEQPAARRLLECATANGAHALAVEAGKLEAGLFADFFTVDLQNVSIAGASSDDLLPLLVFGVNRTALRDVAVRGRMIVQNGRHALTEEIIGSYCQTQHKIWSAQ